MAKSPGSSNTVSVFNRPERRGRSKPTLSRERIVAATVGLLDRQGASALTMRKVAAELGVHATSLYWHVERREDLVELALDEILAEAATGLTPPETRWDIAIKDTARRFYSALRSHSWAAELAASKPLLGPNAVALSRRITSALKEYGGSEEFQAAAIRTVSNQILGAATSMVTMQLTKAESAEADNDLHSAAASQAEVLTLNHDYFEEAMDLLVAGIKAHREP